LLIGVIKMGKAFDEIYAGLNDALNHAKGKPTKVSTHQTESIDVKAIRSKTDKSRSRKNERK
jgi:putative transcriptional regulator